MGKQLLIFEFVRFVMKNETKTWKSYEFRGGHVFSFFFKVPVELHGVVQPRETCVGILITGIDDPTIGLLEHGGAEVVLGVPPVRRARCGAARAENALVETIQKLAIVTRLVVLGVGETLSANIIALQPWLDGLVLIVEISQIRNLIQNQDFGRRKIETLKRKSRFRGFRGR